MLKIDLTSGQRARLGRMIEHVIGTTVGLVISGIDTGTYCLEEADSLEMLLVGGYGTIKVPLTDETGVDILRQIFEEQESYGGQILEFLEELENHLEQG